MRRVALIAILLALVIPARAAVTPEIDPRASLSVVQQWIYNYRAKFHVGNVRGQFDYRTKHGDGIRVAQFNKTRGAQGDAGLGRSQV